MLGKFDTKIIMKIEIIIMGVLSLTENLGWNLILSILVWELAGLDEPFSCNKIMCTKAIPAIAIGRMKCSEKNRLRVG